MTLHLEAPDRARSAAAPCVALRPLDWDTAFFGARMGTIALLDYGEGSPARRAAALEVDLRRALAKARAGGYAHLILRTPAEDLALAWAAGRVGLQLVDVGVDSTIDLTRAALPAASPATALRDARETDLPALRELAASAFVLSRFSADPFFSEQQVREFHCEWIKNLMSGLAKAVLVAERGGEVIGFVSCGLSGDEGRIPLIACGEGQRGRGLGRALVAAALRWFAANGARMAHVKTQAVNYPALALYHRSGFNVSKTELTFSITLDPAGSR